MNNYILCDKSKYHWKYFIYVCVCVCVCVYACVCFCVCVCVCVSCTASADGIIKDIIHIHPQENPMYLCDLLYIHVYTVYIGITGTFETGPVTYFDNTAKLSKLQSI
jgi:hypothetical protein